MLLLNTAGKVLETKFDGQFVIFQPLEKKVILDRVMADHVLFKLLDYGVVEIPDRTEVMEAKLDSEILAKFYIKGLQARRKYLNGVVQNFRTMNKEREAAKLSAEQPSDFIVECVKEIKAIDALLSSLRANDLSMVSEFLSTTEQEEASKTIEESLSGRVDMDHQTGDFKVTGLKNGDGVVLPPNKVQDKGRRAKTHKV